MWASLFQFSTGDRRVASTVLDLDSGDIPDVDWRESVCPYLLEVEMWVAFYPIQIYWALR